MKRKGILSLFLLITVACLLLIGASDKPRKMNIDNFAPAPVRIQSGVYDPVKQLSPPGGVGFWPSIAINNKDEIMVVFTHDLNGSALYYTMSKDGGDTWSPPTRTYSINESGKACDLAADSKGNFHLVYSDGFSSVSRQIYYRAYINGVWQPKEQLSFIPDNSNWCRVAVDGDDIYIVWYQELGWPKKPIIYLDHMKNGVWDASPEDVFQDPGNGYIYPALDAINGNVYVISQIQAYAGDTVTTKEVIFREKRQGQWLPAFKVGLYAWPGIRVDNHSTVHCIYPDHKKVNYRARIGENNWQNETKISNSGVDGFFDLDYRSNTLVAAYMGDASRNPDHWSIYLSVKKYDKGWGSWGIPIETDMGGYADVPRVAIDSEGYAHVVWVDWHDQAIREPDTVWYNKWKVGGSDVPFLDLNNFSLSFEAQQGETAETQNFRVRNSGPGTLDFQVSTDENWISVYPTSGTCGNDWVDIWVDVDTSIDEGTHTGIITITSPKADNSPVTLDVALKVLPPPIYEPSNFTVQKKENKSYFFREIVHFLTWEEHPLNKDIVKYLITCEFEANGVKTTKVFEVGSSNLQYSNRMVIEDTEYTYSIQAVDDKDRVGPPAVFIIK